MQTDSQTTVREINDLSEGDPLVSVCMITYNHEKFISEAIEGVLMQQTDFPIELVIGEDCSTDRTREICLEYKEKYPDKIRLLLNEKNLGMMPNFIQTLQACTGKYIALCEGDDYWTDQLKLQKQVDFLENDISFSFTCHGFYEYSEDEGSFTRSVSIFEKKSMEIGKVIEKYAWAQPLTIVLRKEHLSGIPFEKYNHFRDSHLIYHLLKSGRLYYFNFYGGVYRKHGGGIASKLEWNQQLVDIYHVSLDISRINAIFSVRKRFYWVAKHFLSKRVRNINNQNNPFSWKDVRSVSLIGFVVYLFWDKIQSTCKNINFTKKLHATLPRTKED